jgi:hypothetical protein
MTSYDSASVVSNLAAEAIAESAPVINAVSHKEVVETIISSLDQYDNALVNHSNEGYIWKFKYGSVDVFVQLTGNQDEDTFTAWSPVLQLPVENEPQLFRKLLEMNWLTTAEAQFGIFNQQVMVLASRSVVDLSSSEISRVITMVATIADDHDEALQAEFSASAPQ